MSGQQDLAWETQDGVRSLQAALNSQPPVPMPLASWDTNTNSIPKLEGLDTIDLSTAPLMRSNTESGILTITRFQKGGSLRDSLHGANPGQNYLRKYCSPKRNQALQLNDLRQLGWQILKALEALQERGLPHGNLHIGNILIRDGCAVLCS